MAHKKKNYGKRIVFVDHYCQAPYNAKYILRGLDDGTARFELYEDDTNIVLWDTDYGAMDNQRNLEQTLKKCRLIAGTASIIYVETPSWMYSDEEVDEFEEYF